MATMSQKSSLPQLADSVSGVLTLDSLDIRQVPTRSCCIGQRTDLDVLELHIARVTLQADMALARAPIASGDGIIGYDLSIQRNLYGRAPGLDLERVPLAGRLRGNQRRGRQPIHRAGLVQGTVVLPRRRVEPHVVDLNLVPAIGSQLPIACRIA